MSIETWKREYYPTRADSGHKQDALMHSLRKWRGLRPSALKRHRVRIEGKVLKDNAGNTFYFSCVTCSLCFHYCIGNSCGTCPLFESRNYVRCDNAAPGEYRSPFTTLQYENNPIPMIKALEKAVKYVKQQEKERNSKR